MHPDVDKFLIKTERWREEITKLRSILLKTKLEEDFKWGKPCYSYKGTNVVIIQPFRSCLAMMFFKGSLLKDPKGILVDNGPNSQAGRRFEFGSAESITKLTSVIKSYINEAIDIEESGQKVAFKKNPEPIPPELKEVFTRKPKFKKAFEALTPGRQRAYILHFSNAKQSATRQSRIEKCLPRILEGKGLNDR